MLYETSLPIHPSKQERPRDIAKLFVFRAELDDMNSVCRDHGSAEIVGVTPLPIVPAFSIEVLCRDPETAFALREAWGAYCDASPHRPRNEEEELAWGEKCNPYPNIPRDWTF
jgi:hypothetical protein